ncbi:UNC-50 family protein [Planoprotostelium fungivorum]|uniref:UNC-50 family protein n=1 Tax=Planoprotostelium fungivorum TaxID=1890364 RepID=A0A2P6N5C0_9EUKA|nr:UNC-50 family protein [Planoprotostelium fungivorum]
MLPGAGYLRNQHSRLPEYLRRLLSYTQMDIEYTFWQMFYLCFNPSRVYRTTSWHKQTKNQWARDDPAFVAILLFFMSVASMAFAVAFKVGGFIQIVKLMFWAVFFDFVTIGVITASIGWWLSNRYLRLRNSLHSVDQSVEWLYSFDIHCNSFFPLFLILYVVQFFLLPLLLSTSFFSTFLANTLYLLAIAYYYYNTFLGYNALPFLQNQVVFLYPIAGLFVVYVISVVFNLNLCIFVMNTYFRTLTHSSQ